MIERAYNNLEKFILPGKALILYWPRRVGKTTLLKKFLLDAKKKYKLDSWDNIKTQQLLWSSDIKKICEYALWYTIIAIDEAQNIPNIWLGLKILVDNTESIIIATWSSSFQLSQHIWEPLTWRKRTLILFPCSQKELLSIYNTFELQEQLENFLIFWSYPEVITTSNNTRKKEILTELVDSYLLKDILALEKIKSPKHLLNLLKLIAFQVGNEVSIHELATKIWIDTKTVARYLDLLEKWFVIKSVGAYSTNLRNEISKKQKYYFFDNGVRNAVINQFNDLETRNDIWALRENFIFIELLKKEQYSQSFADLYFWRNYMGQEIDIIKIQNNIMIWYECKFSPTKKTLPPSEWKKQYPDAHFEHINPKNYLQYLL